MKCGVPIQSLIEIASDGIQFVVCLCELMQQIALRDGEGNGTPLQYSCLENPMGRGAWWAAVYGGLTESDTTEAS